MSLGTTESLNLGMTEDFLNSFPSPHYNSGTRLRSLKWVFGFGLMYLLSVILSCLNIYFSFGSR